MDYPTSVSAEPRREITDELAASSRSRHRQPAYIRYDESVPEVPSQRSRAGAAFAAVTSGWRQFWQGYWQSPGGC